jgi:hypothetical protein
MWLTSGYSRAAHSKSACTRLMWLPQHTRWAVVVSAIVETCSRAQTAWDRRNRAAEQAAACKKGPKWVEVQQVGVARVAKPSRMLPLDDLELRHSAVECRVFMSGMDFLTGREGGGCNEIGGDRQRGTGKGVVGCCCNDDESQSCFIAFC